MSRGGGGGGGGGYERVEVEEDVNTLSFGAVESPEFLPNSSVAILLSKVAEKKFGPGKPVPEVFAKARAYAAQSGPNSVELSS